MIKKTFLLIAILLSQKTFSRGVLPVKRDDELAVVYISLAIILIVVNYLYTLMTGKEFNKDNIMGMAGFALILTVIYWIVR